MVLQYTNGITRPTLNCSGAPQSEVGCYICLSVSLQSVCDYQEIDQVWHQRQINMWLPIFDIKVGCHK